jgi:hypothetical protein
LQGLGNNDTGLMLEVSLRGLPAGSFEIVAERAEAASESAPSVVACWQAVEFEIEGAAADQAAPMSASTGESAAARAETEDDRAHERPAETLKPSPWGDLYILTCISDKNGSRIDLDNVLISNANAYNYPGFNRTAYKSAWYRSLAPWRAQPGVHVRNICGEHVPWSGLRLKVSQMLDFVGTLHSGDLVVFTDFTDVVFNIGGRSPADLVDRFFAHAKPVVLMAEPWCSVGRTCTEYDMQHMYPEAFSSTRSSCPAFVNSGAYMGVAGSVLNMLKVWLHVIDTDPSFYDDQGPLAYVFSTNPNFFHLDREAGIFSSITSGNISKHERSASWTVACSGYAQPCGFDRNLDNVWRVVADGRVSRNPQEGCGLASDPFIVHAQWETEALLPRFKLYQMVVE